MTPSATSDVRMDTLPFGPQASGARGQTELVPVFEVRKAGIKVKGLAPTGGIAQDDADTSGSGHGQIAVGITNQGAFRRGDPQPLAKAMHCSWIRFAGAVVRAPDALKQVVEPVLA